MKNRYLTIAALSCGLVLCGCSTQVGNVSFPQAAADFTPRQTYAGSFDHAWSGVLDALEKNRITVISSEKNSGLIQTDYIQGASNLIGFGIIGAQSTRYKYNITVRDRGDGTVRIYVISKVESTIKGSSGSSQWTDVTANNTQLAHNLENWLYEQIEAGL